ncbi:MAG: ornithine carbamoyltransferase [Thaumarchaeota archaeon]|nr:ornithine carbamoyltransferase [Nitrososphaerota archaeon]
MPKPALPNILTLEELSPKQITSILDLADKLKAERRKGIIRRGLSGKTLVLLFQKASTRTRVSFEVAIAELGGHSIFINPSDAQLSRGETIADTARTLSRFAHVLAVRVYAHKDIEELSEYASIPVINALSNDYHPCQALSDIQTIREKKGNFKKLKLAWVGDGNNVCNALLVASGKVGLNMTVASPKKYGPSTNALKAAKEAARKSGANIEITDDALEAVDGADILATDSFVSMGSEAEAKERLQAFIPEYQVTAKLFARAKRDAIFMHCLPAKRGQEVESKVIDGARSVVWEEAENKLHTHKALLQLYLTN